MKRTEYQIQQDFEDMLHHDEALFEWLDIDERVFDWFEAQPIYRQRFIEWVRGNEAIMDKWREHCSEVVNQVGYGEDI